MYGLRRIAWPPAPPRWGDAAAIPRRCERLISWPRHDLRRAPGEQKIASKLASGQIGEEEHRRARAELGERYGVSWHDERIPEARARFGIGP
jgi:hypothetical protein